MERDMRIINAKVKNFGSYEELNFDFTNQDLCLIQGATGAGKSTLMDVIPWVLFGVTAKDTAADEVKSWEAQDDTTGEILLEMNNYTFGIKRIRGKTNDLQIHTDAQGPNRGSDLKDTQKKINELLGMTPETYLAGAYFHEFSKTASFFITTAKNRREICEQLVDLSFVTKLNAKLSAESKLTKEKLAKTNNGLERLQTEIAKTSETIIYLTAKQETFEKDKSRELEIIHQERLKKIIPLRDLEQKRAILEEKLKHHSVCNHCGAKNQKLTAEYHELNSSIKLLATRIKYFEEQEAMVNKRKNTYDRDIEVYEDKYLKLMDALERTQGVFSSYTDEILNFQLLQETAETLRMSQIENTISFIQDKTNIYLSEYFDAEIKVAFSASIADKIEVEIHKDGNLCSYSQLSKGQRQLLKLCFGISAMSTVADMSGIKFNSIFFDEALDGLDDSLKLKCYRLMQHLALSYESVFVVEHNAELKAVFEKSYVVTLENGRSSINEKSTSNEERKRIT